MCNNLDLHMYMIFSQDSTTSMLTIIEQSFADNGERISRNTPGLMSDFD